MRLSPERIEGYKFFVNKIWNASKLTFANLDDFDETATAEVADSLADLWIKARLNKAVEDVTTALDEYRFNDAAAAVYRFIWHELCDWYLERANGFLRKKRRTKTAAQKPRFVFPTLLKCCIPHAVLTEELWQSSRDKNSYISRFRVCSNEKRRGEKE